MSKIIMGKGKKPFESEELAFAHIEEKLNGQGEVVELGDGFAILESLVKKEAPLKYFKCSIAPRTSENEDEVVDLAVNAITEEV